MKKFITLLVVAVMMFTFAFSANAAVTTGINVDFVEGSDGIITATVSAVGLNNFSGLTLRFTYTASDVTLLAADGSTPFTTAGELKNVASSIDNATFAGWALDTSKTASGSFVLVSAPAVTDGSANINATSKTPLFTLKFKKADGVTIADTTFLIKSSVGSYTFYLNGNTTQMKASNKANNDNFAFSVTPYVGGEEPEEPEEPEPTYTWGTATDVVADEKGVTGTKVAVFGKVSGGDGKKLEDNEYWVTFGQNTYYGKASTSAVTAWAIVIYDPNGTKVEAGRTYGYTAGMTGVPSWTGSVTASAVAAE